MTALGITLYFLAVPILAIRLFGPTFWPGCKNKQKWVGSGGWRRRCWELCHKSIVVVPTLPKFLACRRHHPLCHPRFSPARRSSSLSPSPSLNVQGSHKILFESEAPHCSCCLADITVAGGDYRRGTFPPLPNQNRTNKWASSLGRLFNRSFRGVELAMDTTRYAKWGSDSVGVELPQEIFGNLESSLLKFNLNMNIFTILRLSRYWGNNHR